MSMHGDVRADRFGFGGSLNQALEAVEPGQRLLLDGREWHIEEPLVLDKPITIEGIGRASRILVDTDTYGFVCIGYDGGDAQDGKVILKNLDIYPTLAGGGLARPAGGVRIGPITTEFSGLNQPAYVTLEDVRISGFDSLEAVHTVLDGMPALEQGAGVLVTQGQGIDFIRCILRNNWRGFVEWGNHEVTTLTFERCMFRGSNDEGCRLAAFATAALRSCVFEDNDGAGMKAVSPLGMESGGGFYNLTLESCHFEQNNVDHGDYDLEVNVLDTDGGNPRNVRIIAPTFNSRAGKKGAYLSKCRETVLESAFPGYIDRAFVKTENTPYNGGVRIVMGRDDGLVDVDANTVVEWRDGTTP